MKASASITSLAAHVRAARGPADATAIALIDGPAGAGKTTLANRLAVALGGQPSAGPGTFDPGAPVATDVRVLHADDMYEGWSGLASLPDVLVPQVLEPVSAGRSGQFRMWDWEQSARTHSIPVPPPAFLIVEGVGVASRAARPFASLVVFVDAPRATRMSRGIARDGEHMRAEWEKWQGPEAAHFAAEGTRAAAHVVVDGTQPTAE